MNHSRIYNSIISKAKPRGLNKKVLEGYFEKHHIVPKCMGGGNEQENLVLLTAKEHFICHALLCYVYPKNTKLLYAFFMLKSMTEIGQARHVSSQEYQRLKVKYSSEISERLTGTTHTDETKSKMSTSAKGVPKSEEARRNMSLAATGRKASEEAKAKMSEQRSGSLHWNYGKSVAEETKKKISDSLLGKPSWNKGLKSEKVVCPHCDLLGGISNMKRYHFSNCKKLKERPNA